MWMRGQVRGGDGEAQAGSTLRAEPDAGLRVTHREIVRDLSGTLNRGVADRMMALREVHVLTPGTCGCDTLPRTEDVASVMKLRTLRWGVGPQLSGGPVLPQGPCTGRQESPRQQSGG